MVTEAKEQNLSDLDLPLADCHSLRAMLRAPAGPLFTWRRLGALLALQLQEHPASKQRS